MKMSINVDQSVISEIARLPELVLLIEPITTFLNLTPSFEEDYVLRVIDYNFDEVSKIHENNSYENYEKHIKLIIGMAIEEKKRIILIDYSPDFVKHLKTFLDNSTILNNNNFLCIAFFHNDEDTKECEVEDIPDLIKEKNKIIKYFDKYHFVKKIIIPLDCDFDLNFFIKLMNEVVF